MTSMNYLNKLLSSLLGKELDAKVKAYFISGAYKSILLQGAIALLTFLTTLFIARSVGDKGFGVYTIVFNWISIISVGATLGLDDLALKQFPVYKEKKAIGQAKGLLYWTNGVGAIMGIMSALCFLLVVYQLDVNYKEYYWIAVWVIPLFSLMHINQATMRALGFIGLGQLAEKFVQPFTFLLCLVGVYFLGSSTITDGDAIGARTLSFVVTVVVALYLIWKHTGKIRQTKEAIYESKMWWKSCKYFAITSLLYILNTRLDIIFLDWYEVQEAEVAYYNAALKLSDMALIPFAVLYTVTAPMFSQLYTNKKTEELQEFFVKTTRIACLVVSSILLVLILGGELFLGLFGDSFKAGYPILLIMCLIKFIHVFVGPVNYLLMMIDLEKEAMWCLVASVGLTIILHVILIPWYGIVGASWATLGGLLCFEILVSWLAYSKGGIVPTILGSFFSRKHNS